MNKAEEDAFIEYADHALTELVPKMAQTSVVLSLIPRTRADIKWATEMGVAVYMDKPIIAIIEPGAKISSKIALVADYILELDMNNPSSFGRRLQEILDNIGDK